MRLIFLKFSFLRFKNIFSFFLIQTVEIHMAYFLRPKLNQPVVTVITEIRNDKNMLQDLHQLVIKIKH